MRMWIISIAQLREGDGHAEMLKHSGVVRGRRSARGAREKGLEKMHFVRQLRGLLLLLLTVTRH